ncbi:MAG TPA: hypothetical protein PLP33_30070 [Leptospiraceae bacterium]|nr:hypothetical protein [Leptospiraceae bacterium]
MPDSKRQKRKLKGDFLKTKERNKTKQRTFDKVKKAQEELKTKPTTTLWFQGYLLEVEAHDKNWFPDHNNIFIGRTKRGYKLLQTLYSSSGLIAFPYEFGPVANTFSPKSDIVVLKVKNILKEKTLRKK